jgi:hypothetical protein
MSVGVYNTDLDPTRRAARRIVRFLADVEDEWRASETRCGCCASDIERGWISATTLL